MPPKDFFEGASEPPHIQFLNKMYFDTTEVHYTKSFFPEIDKFGLSNKSKTRFCFNTYETRRICRHTRERAVFPLKLSFGKTKQSFLRKTNFFEKIENKKSSQKQK